ncbi:VirB4 family type IV secretion system protein [Thauera mechernichensis]
MAATKDAHELTPERILEGDAVLNVRKLVKNYDDSAQSFAELIPWLGQIAPDVVICKDGSFLACFEYEGMDSEGVEQHLIDRASSLTEHALRTFDERFTVWWTLERKKTYRYPNGNFENEISSMVDHVWKQSFVESGQYVNRHFLSVLYTPPGGVDGVFEKIAYFTKTEQMGLWKAIAETIRSSLFRRNAFHYESSQLSIYLDEFTEQLAAFEQIVSDLSMKRLRDEDLLGFLYRRSTPTTSAEQIKRPNVPFYLDSYLNGSTLVGRGDTLYFHGERETHVAAVSIKDWPNTTFPGLLDDLMAVTGELVITQVLRVASTDASRRFIQDIERHNRNMAKSLKTYLVESFTKEESRQVDVGRIAMADDANDALTEISTVSRVYGHYNLTVLTYGSTANEADDLAKVVHRLLSQKRFVAIRENMHLLSCFAGAMPGQAGALVRWHFVSTANVCDLAPLRSLGIGNPINHHFTEQFSTEQFPIPSLTVFPTEYSTPYFFNFHQSDLAHTLVVGPSRSGKSIFNNFLISQLQKYYPCHTFIFDKDYSSRIPTILQGGTHVDLAGDKATRIPLNPMLLLEDKKHWTWLSSWIEDLIGARGYAITSADTREIWLAIGRLAELPRSMWRLVTLGSMIPSHLHEHLEQWIGEGAKAHYFDNEVDSFDLGSFTCVEMGKLFQDTTVAKAFIDYAFFRISLKLDGRPALIYLEEAWFLLEEEGFAAKVNDWLRTLGKRNAWILMATQSLDEIANSKIFTTIIDNIPNRIYLPNSNAFAHYEMYTQKFGLNDTQIGRIQSAVPKYNYYIVTPALSRMVCVPLQPEILAVVRSDSKAQRVFDRHYTSGVDTWKINYLEEMVDGR